MNGEELIIPRPSEVPRIIEYFYNEYKGENGRKLWHRIRHVYCNISRQRVQLWLNSCEKHGTNYPLFKNKNKLKPVASDQPMDQVQVDLVDFSARPSVSADKTYRYVFAFLDVFSRFLVLAPMEGKTATEAAALFKEVVLQFGIPKRLQTDRGSEFQGRNSFFCYNSFIIKMFLLRLKWPQISKQSYSSSVLMYTSYFCFK